MLLSVCLNIWKSFRGLKVDKMIREPRQRGCCVCGGRDRRPCRWAGASWGAWRLKSLLRWSLSQGMPSACALWAARAVPCEQHGLPAPSALRAARAVPCEQHRLPAQGPAHSTGASGPWQARCISGSVRCSVPWHWWKGGRKGAAGSNLCCLKRKLFGLQCAARVFLGFVLRADLVAWKFHIFNLRRILSGVLLSCWAAAAKSSKAWESLVLLIRVLVINLQVEHQIKLKCLTI